MLWLPTLADGDGIWRLPLSDLTAVRLTEALLADEATRRSDLLTTALRDDPVLTLWIVCRMHTSSAANSSFSSFPSSGLGTHSDSQQIPTITDIAGWLSANALEVLIGPGAAETAQPSLEEEKRWTDLVYRGVLIALKSADFSHDDEAAYVLGLLHAAHRSMELAGSACNDVSLPLPAWLSAALSSVANAATTHKPVCFAQKAIDAAGGRTPTLQDSQARYAWQTARRWQHAIPGAGTVLFMLVRKLARLTELETNFERSLEREKLAALKEFAYGASHEINNPLANISTRAQTLLRDEQDEERRRKLATINTQAFRAHEMISDLMLFAKPPCLQIQQVEITAVIDRVITELLPQAKAQGTTITFESSDEPVIIEADADHLSVALKALGDNALEALAVGGDIIFSVTRRTSVSSEWVEISVADTGSGITPEVRRHLFDPFFSGREAGRGLGFGLSKCWRIVSDHGGTIHVDSVAGQGATFQIRLPVKFSQAQANRAA